MGILEKYWVSVPQVCSLLLSAPSAPALTSGSGGQFRLFHGSAGFGFPVRVTGVLSLGDFFFFFDKGSHYAIMASLKLVL